MEDHLQVAIQLMQAQRFPEARQLLKQFTKKNQKHADGWFLFGQLERTLQNWPDAIAHLRKAQHLAPQSLAVTEYLAMTQLFSNQGRAMIPAIENFAALLKAMPDSPSAVAMAVNLQTLCLRINAPQRLLEAVQPFFAQYAPHGAERLRLAAGLAMASYLSGDIAGSQHHVAQVMQLRPFAWDEDGAPLPGDYPFYFIYADFIRQLIAARKANPASYAGEASKTCHVIGESHCMTPAYLTVNGYRLQPHLLMGAKAYYFGIAHGESWQYHLSRILGELPRSEPAIVMFGEIDCRSNEGIMHQWMNDAAYAMEMQVAELVRRYVKFVKLAQLKRSGQTFIYGVPAPVRSEVKVLPPERLGDFTRMIRHFNQCLANEAAAQSLPFIDIYARTVGEDGWAEAGMHLDGIHLTPRLLADALAAALA